MNYKSRKWQKARKAHLSREPLCRACGRAGSQVDHVKPISAGGDPWDHENMQTLCASCHSKKTRIESAGGVWQITGADGYPVGGHWWNEQTSQATFNNEKSLGAEAADRIAETF